MQTDNRLFDDLVKMVPQALLQGYVNPAPAEDAEKE